jgi:hypothetical protein
MIDTSLIQLLPPIGRARGDRLYAQDKHWVDLWKQGGAWLLGHRPEGAAREWKNQIDKGLASVLPSRWPLRLQTHLNALLKTQAQLFLYPNEDSAVNALGAWKGQSFTFQDRQIARWCPLLGEGIATPVPREPWSGVLLPVLPGGPAQAFPVLVSGPTGGLSAPPLLAVTESAALVRAVVTLTRKLGDPAFLAAIAAVQKGFDRHVAPNALFQRVGHWLTARCPPED